MRDWDHVPYLRCSGTDWIYVPVPLAQFVNIILRDWYVLSVDLRLGPVAYSAVFYEKSISLWNLVTGSMYGIVSLRSRNCSALAGPV